MPISYQPPSPVSPYTSAAYGAAEEYDKVAPLVQQARAQQLQAGIAAAGAYNQGGQEVTQRTIAAGIQNTQLEGLHQSQLFHAQQVQQEQAQQAAMQYAQQEQAAAQQRRHYEDTVNASYQQMTQAENLRLQAVREADNWIDEQGDRLDPETRMSMKAGVRGVRSPLEYKAAQQQIETQKAHATLWKQQAELQDQHRMQMGKVEAMTMDERTKHTYDPAVVAQVEREMGPRPVSPFDMLGKMYDADLKQRVEADPNGIMATHIVQSDGKLVEIKRPNAHADRQVQDVEAAKRHWQSSYTEQSKEVERAIDRDVKAGLTNRENWTAEGKNEAIRNRMQVAVGAPTLEAYLGNVLGGKARPPHVAGSKFAVQGVEGQPPPPQQPDRVAQPAPESPSRAKPFDPTNIHTQDAMQRDALNFGEKAPTTYLERPDLSQQQKETAIAHVNHIKRLFAERGSYEKMTDKEKREVQTGRAYLEGLPPPPKAPVAAAQPAAPAPVQPDTYAPFSY